MGSQPHLPAEQINIDIRNAEIVETRSNVMKSGLISLRSKLAKKGVRSVRPDHNCPYRLLFTSEINRSKFSISFLRLAILCCPQDSGYLLLNPSILGLPDKSVSVGPSVSGSSCVGNGSSGLPSAYIF